jgi:hypothetical protein
MRATKFLTLAAALILVCVWAWASSAGRDVAARMDLRIDPFQVSASAKSLSNSH